jgi:hypothetical protein
MSLRHSNEHSKIRQYALIVDNTGIYATSGTYTLLSHVGEVCTMRRGRV